MRRIGWSVLGLILVLLLVACGSAQSEGGTSGGDHAFNYGGDVTLRILSGSENQELEGILDDFARERGVNIEMDYQGSLDIMRALQGETIDYDAVWPASSLWLTAGDTQYRVKHAQSISITPVVFGLRQSLAEELGFVGREVSVSDLLSAIQAGELEFCMTSATQSNSGCSAYIGFLYALLGNPDVITSESLQTPSLSEQITRLLSGVDRSSGSSDWLKDLFLTGGYDAMVNYECLIISANQELEARGRRRCMPSTPMTACPSPTPPWAMWTTGHREGTGLSGFTGVSPVRRGAKRDPAHRTPHRLRGGVGGERRRVPRRLGHPAGPSALPHPDALHRCAHGVLDLYQTEFRKPSLTVYCLDYSGSMEGTGREQMVEAMSQILIQENAEQNLLQASEHEVNILIPFEGYPRDVYTAVGNGEELEALYTQVEAEEAVGGTDIYYAAMEGLRQLKNYDLSQYTPAIILLTDGVSDGSFSDFRDGYEAFGADVPVFSIMFGSADPTQLEELAELTHARVFDGREDLIGAFRSVKGYN